MLLFLPCTNDIRYIFYKPMLSCDIMFCGLEINDIVTELWIFQNRYV